jgi:hypothetical protein
MRALRRRGEVRWAKSRITTAPPRADEAAPCQNHGRFTLEDQLEVALFQSMRPVREQRLAAAAGQVTVDRGALVGREGGVNISGRCTIHNVYGLVRLKRCAAQRGRWLPTARRLDEVGRRWQPTRRRRSDCRATADGVASDQGQIAQRRRQLGRRGPVAERSGSGLIMRWIQWQHSAARLAAAARAPHRVDERERPMRAQSASDGRFPSTWDGAQDGREVIRSSSWRPRWLIESGTMPTNGTAPEMDRRSERPFRGSQ